METFDGYIHNHLDAIPAQTKWTDRQTDRNFISVLCFRMFAWYWLSVTFRSRFTSRNRNGSAYFNRSGLHSDFFLDLPISQSLFTKERDYGTNWRWYKYSTTSTMSPQCQSAALLLQDNLANWHELLFLISAGLGTPANLHIQIHWQMLGT